MWGQRLHQRSQTRAAVCARGLGVGGALVDVRAGDRRLSGYAYSMSVGGKMHLQGEMNFSRGRSFTVTPSTHIPTTLAPRRNGATPIKLSRADAEGRSRKDRPAGIYIPYIRRWDRSHGEPSWPSPSSRRPPVPSRRPIGDPPAASRRAPRRGWYLCADPVRRRPFAWPISIRR